MYKVENLCSAKGNKVANQFKILADNHTIFQSYDSIIVDIDKENKTITFGPDYDFSKTTSKYLNVFWREVFSQSLKRAVANDIIKNGKYLNYTVIFDENIKKTT